MGCSGYLDKIYKILDILDVKTGFPPAIFFIRSNLFCSKTIKSTIGSYTFLLQKVTNQWKCCKKSLNIKKSASANPHKKVSQDLTEKKQDLTEMSIILMVLIEI